jgi:flagellar hook protein FlgE
VDISTTALDGLHRAEIKLEKAATRIASFGASVSGGANSYSVDLSAEIVAIMSAKTAFSANLKSLQTAGEEQNNLVDLMA